MVDLTPTVTGISPKEGTPGTKLTVRGENLGTSANDILFIHVGTVDVACSVQWYSSSKLSIISSHGTGELKIIVTTKFGGKGECTVDYNQSIPNNIGLQDEVSFWPPNEIKLHQASTGPSKQSQSRHMETEMIESIQNFGGLSEGMPVNFAISDEELSNFFKGQGSTSMTEADFNPVLYLLKYHCNTSYADLVLTLKLYRKAMDNDKMKEPISIVQANLYSIFQCLECLEALKKKMDNEKTDQRAISGAFVENDLSNTLEVCKTIAHKMYEEVLRRRDYADSARMAHAAMQRFQFLFNLPHSIRQNIEKGNYNLVINDFLRARTLFGRSSIRLFQQVYKDVEGIIENFKKKLEKDLLTPPFKCESSKYTIRLLKELEVENDPTLDCLKYQKEWISRCINKLSVGNISTGTNSSTQTSQRLTKSSTDSATSTNTHPIVEMMKQLNNLLTESVMDMWNLASYYLEYEAGCKDTTNLLVDDVVRAYALKVRESVNLATASLTHSVGGTNANNSNIGASAGGNWLVYCLQQARAAIETLPITELPENCGPLLVCVLEEVRVRAVRGLLTRGAQDVNGLGFQESWFAEITDAEGALTHLPIQFRNIVTTVFTEISRVLHSRHSMEKQPTILSTSNVVATNIVTSTPGESSDLSEFCESIATLLNSFVTSIRTILLQILSAANISTSPSSDSINNAATTDEVASENIGETEEAPKLNTRLLLLLANNIRHTASVVNPSLLQQMTKFDLPGAVAIATKIRQPYSQLYDEICRHYIRQRLLDFSIVSTISQALINTAQSWKYCPAPIKVSPYVQSIISMMASDHSETSLLCPSMTSIVLACLAKNCLETVQETLSNENSPQKNWCRAGYIQFLVDLSVLDVVFTTASKCLPKEQEKSTVCEDQQSSATYWMEVVSLLNVLRNKCRLTQDENVVVKSIVDKELQMQRMLINGLQ